MPAPTTADIAKRLAAKVFDERGNNSEVHLKRAELEGLLEIATQLGAELRPRKPVPEVKS